MAIDDPRSAPAPDTDAQPADDGTRILIPVATAVHARLRDLAEVCGSTVEGVVHDAALAHLRVQAGEPTDPRGGEFRKVGSDRQAQVVLRQDSDIDFFQLEPFRYRDGKGRAWDVPYGRTDLASVPPMMTWLVPRYGRHTLPALLHDHLQDPALGVSSWDADTVFRDSMRATGVPFVRRWAMWSAVATRSLVHESGVWWALVALWVIVYGVAAGLVGWPWMLAEGAAASPALAVTEVVLIVLAAAAVTLQDKGGRLAPAGRALFPVLAGGVIGLAIACAVVLAVEGETWVVTAQLLLVASPVVTALLWGRRAYRVALISGVAFSLLAIPALLVLWALLVYRAAEGFAAMFRKGENPVTVNEWQAMVDAAGSPAQAAAPPAET